MEKVQKKMLRLMVFCVKPQIRNYAPNMIQKRKESGKNGVDCYSKNGHAVTVLTRQS